MVNKNELVELLEEYDFTEEQINRLSKNKTLLAKGNIDKIENNLKILININISLDRISKCSIVLYKNDFWEIKEILKVLEEYEISKETIENCLYVLARGKAQEIEKILKVLDIHQISKETIENCLSVLAIGKTQEIEKILKVLDIHQISKETIEKCLYVLARGKAQEIEKILEILDIHQISNEIIEENYSTILLKNKDEIIKIFSRNSKDIDNKTIKIYMKLKGYYDRVVTQEELTQVSEFKNVNIDEIIKKILNIKDIKDINEIKRNLKIKGGLYIGKSIPMDKQDMDKYADTILDISKKISNSLSYKYKYDKGELESFCISTLIEKCGNIVYNIDINQEFLYGALYNKTKKYCKGYILSQKDNFNVNFNILENTTKTAKDNENYYEKKKINLKQWNLNPEDEEIMNILSNYLEMGYDNKEAFEHTAQDLDLDIEELMYNIEEIKNQIVNENKKLKEQNNNKVKQENDLDINKNEHEER